MSSSSFVHLGSVRDESSDSPVADHAPADGWYTTDPLATAERPEPPAAPLERDGADRWERTQQIARCIVDLGEFRNALQVTSESDVARLLLSGVDREVMRIGDYLAARLREDGRSPAGPPPDVQAAVAIVEWLVVTLEGAGVESDEALSSVYPSLATIRRWSAAA